MQISKTYYSLPISVQNFIFSLYGYYLRRKLYNGLQKEYCEILRENERLPKEEHEKRQLPATQKKLPFWRYDLAETAVHVQYPLPNGNIRQAL